jgi:hypothetical protein
VQTNTQIIKATMEGRTTIRRQGKNKGKAVIGESMFAQESTRIGEKGNLPHNIANMDF